MVDEPTLCHVLPVEDFVELQSAHPEVAASIYRALALSLAGRLRRTTRLLRTLQS